MLFKCVGTDPESNPAGSVAILESIDGSCQGATIKVRSDVPASFCPKGQFVDGQVFDVRFIPMKPTNAPAYEPIKTTR